MKKDEQQKALFDLNDLEVEKPKKRTEFDDFSEVISHLNTALGFEGAQGFKATTKNTQSFIRARLKEGFTIEDFKTVIDKKSRQWLNNPEMRKFLRPATLFCAKHFESYLIEIETIEKSKNEKQRDKIIEATRKWTDQNS